MRRADWLPRLLEYVEAVRLRPFDPVAHNCALFVAGAVEAVTGSDPRAELGLNIATQRDVIEALIRYGGVRGLATASFGPVQARLLARRGDVMVRQGIDGDTLGVCMGDHALFLGPDGLQVRQLDECDASWSVE